MNACTIIAKNYLAHARVLAQSFREHHPDGRFTVLIIDNFEGYIEPEAEPFEIVTPEELRLPEFADMASRYDVLELSTAVKPWLLEYLLERDDHVVYLDPDIRIFAPIEDIAEACRRSELVLTPHNLTAIPRDGRKPSEGDILIAGAYNLGFIGLGRSETADHLLEWWSERLRTDCIVDPVKGFFVDQRWIDLVPSMVHSLEVLRDPGCNVAYWNLHAREVAQNNGSLLVNGARLRFFHFSGYDPAVPTELSKHQNRIVLSEEPVLRELCDAYAAELRDAGYDDVSSWPYSYAATVGGVQLPRPVRRAWADGVLAGAIEHPVFEPEGERELLNWLAGPAPEGAAGGINRIMWAWYVVRPDLQRAFPDLNGRDAPGLIEWFQTRGATELDVPTDLVPPADEPEPRTAPADIDVTGVNVVGYFTSEVGVGEIARLLLSGLDAVGVPTFPVGLIATASRQDHPFEYGTAGDAPHPVNLVLVNADQFSHTAAELGESFFRDRYTIGMWWWETPEFPAEWESSFDHVDELWVGSRFMADVLAPLSPVPVVPMTVPVQLPNRIEPDRERLGLPTGFVFLFSFDFNSVFGRKNPLGLIDAYTRAFPEPRDDISLVIKSINGERFPLQLEQLTQAAAERDDVLVIDRYLSADEKNSLVASCDCYVSLHRSEGLGLTLLEAMRMGKPVIATANTGAADYVLPAHSFPVDWTDVPVGEGHDPYHADATWGEPDLDQAARYMRQVVDDPGGARERGERAAEFVRRRYGLVTAGEAMRKRLARLRRRPEPEPVDALLSGPETALADLQAVVGRGPLRSPLPLWNPRRLARALMLRLSRPQSAYQEEVDARVAEALGEVAAVTASRDDELNRRVRGTREVLESRHESLRESLRRELADAVKRLPQLSERIEYLLQASADASTHVNALDEHVTGLQEFADRMTSQPDFERSRAIYPALGELGRRYGQVGTEPGPADGEADLSRFELRVFSQNGEDGVLAEILRRIGVGPQPFFVEFGIESGAEGNCVFLADVLGWSGLFIEADAEQYPRLEAKYRWSEPVRTLHAFVTPENADDLFTQAGVPEEPDILSIDIDGPDLWVWRSVERFRPRLVIIEVNSSLDPNRRLVQPPDHQWDKTEYQGASLGALEAVGREKGYRLVHVDLAGVNAFFVRDDLPGEWARPRPRGVNLYLSADGHPPDEERRAYLELDD